MLIKGKTVVISSQVAHGSVGGNMTSFVLKLNGQETFVVPTSIFSNHLGLDTVGGGALSSHLFKELLEGISKLNAFKYVDTIITGFFDSVEQILLTAEWISDLKKQNPDIQYICDPVMGDFKDGGLFVPEPVANAMVSYLVPVADLLTPNHFEFERIIGEQMRTPAKMMDAFLSNELLHAKKFIVTGCQLGHDSIKTMDNVILDSTGYRYISDLKVNLDPVGAGDLFTALVYMQLRLQIELAAAVKNSATMMVTLINDMLREGRKEFELKDLLKTPMLINSVAAVQKVLLN